MATDNKNKLGIMICGHGSRDHHAIHEFEHLALKIAKRFPDQAVEYGFLEFAKPIIREGLDKLRNQGVQQVLAVPGMLFAAGHAKDDIPSVLNGYRREHPGFDIRYGRDLSVDLRLLKVAQERIETAERASLKAIPRHETLLLVVGRGTSDPDANSNIAKVARLLCEGMGFGWVEVAYSGVTFPLVGPGLEHAAKLGYRRIIVFPYFLFTGILVKRIYGIVDEMAALRPDIEFLKADYLKDHPLVVDTFIERIQEILQGQNNMNCQLCKYREQIIGFESEVGQPQLSHHHHVEGIMANHDDHHHDDHHHDDHHDHPHDHHHHHGHDHHHDHSHDHGHTHRPYPQADHPHGPKYRNPEKL